MGAGSFDIARLVCSLHSCLPSSPTQPQAKRPLDPSRRGVNMCLCSCSCSLQRARYRSVHLWQHMLTAAAPLSPKMGGYPIRKFDADVNSAAVASLLARLVTPLISKLIHLKHLRQKSNSTGANSGPMAPATPAPTPRKSRSFCIPHWHVAKKIASFWGRACLYTSALWYTSGRTHMGDEVVTMARPATPWRTRDTVATPRETIAESWSKIETPS